MEVTINGGIYVDLPVLVSAEDDFRRVLSALEAELDRLEAELGASVGEWTGEAKAAYQAAYAQWRTAAGDMVKKLAWLQGVIRTARLNYHSARSTNLGMWKGA